ncbi:MAG: hypothetical protein FJ242_04090 [Nitrospira sp.]|nr:hypothetical protein [Nitrospira sp.]
MKTILSTRPIYHKCDETIRGHVFCSFLSLLLIKDLDELKEIRIQTGNKEVLLRSELKGIAGKAFQATGVAVSPIVRIIGMDDKGTVTV